MRQHELFFTDLVTDFLLGGVSGAVSNTLTAPIERVRKASAARRSDMNRKD